MARHRSLFESTRCLVCADGLAPSVLLALECALRDGGATLLVDGSGDDAATTATHIVCLPDAYKRFSAQRDHRFVALVRPEWVFRSFLVQQRLPEDRFSANPALFFATLAVAAGPIDKDPRKVVDGLIAHFGGQIVVDERAYDGATHVLAPEGSTSKTPLPERIQRLHLSYSDKDVARAVNDWREWLASRPTSLSFELPSCLTAFLGKHAGLAAQFHINYSWIEECVRRKSRVPEGAFATKNSAVTAVPDPISWKSKPVVELDELKLRNCAVVYQLAQTEFNTELALLRKSTEKLAAAGSELSGAIVLLAQHIPPLLKDKLLELLKSVKAKVANVPLGESYQDIVRKVVTNAAFVVCRYRAGFEYEEAVRQNRRIVSIYWVLGGGDATQGERSRFAETIERPVMAYGGIPGMQSFVITLSGYTSRTSPSREEVQVAISSTGACMLPVLSRTNSTHLLCYEPVGEKFKKAKTWRFANILSHEWLFDCLNEWKYLAEDAYGFDGASKKQPVQRSSNASADASSRESDQTAEVVANEDQEPSDTTTSKSASTTKPQQTSRKRGRNARFDVAEMLTELDESAPTEKKGNGATTQPSDDKSKSKGEPNAPCQLFDTPSKISSAEADKDKDTEDALAHNAEPEAESHVEESKSTRRKSTRESRTSKRDKNAKQNDALSDEVSADGTKDTAGSEVPESSRKTKAAAKAPAAISSRKRKATSLDKTDIEEPDPSSASKQESTPAKKKKGAKRQTAPSPTANSGGSKSRGGFVFLLTGSHEECAVNESIVLELGGKVSDVGRRFDGESTHIICSELKRTEKFVAGCAAGKWILRPSYLEASSAAGRFVDETPHEWGARPDDKALMDERIWPGAPAFWRKERAAGKPGAFTGWRFLVHAKCVPPADMCERIVLAAGGEMVAMTKTTDWAALASENSEDRPVVALVPSNLPARDAWLKKIKAHKLECINATFLIDVLTKQQSPAVERAQYRV